MGSQGSALAGPPHPTPDLGPVWHLRLAPGSLDPHTPGKLSPTPLASGQAPFPAPSTPRSSWGEKTQGRQSRACLLPGHQGHPRSAPRPVSSESTCVSLTLQGTPVICLPGSCQHRRLGIEDAPEKDATGSLGNPWGRRTRSILCDPASIRKDLPGLGARPGAHHTLTAGSPSAPLPQPRAVPSLTPSWPASSHSTKARGHMGHKTMGADVTPTGQT